MYILFRNFPRLLPYFYRRSFLNGIYGPVKTRLALSFGIRDKAYHLNAYYLNTYHLKSSGKEINKKLMDKECKTIRGGSCLIGFKLGF
ncbi:hypothetical protein P3S67_010617 [Capsicum chacoense]